MTEELLKWLGQVGLAAGSKILSFLVLVTVWHHLVAVFHSDFNIDGDSSVMGPTIISRIVTANLDFWLISILLVAWSVGIMLENVGNKFSEQSSQLVGLPIYFPCLHLRMEANK